MNDNLTINGITFNRSSQDAAGSVRFDNTAGLLNPRIMTIKRQNAVNSADKVPERRYLMRFELKAGSGLDNDPKYTAYAYMVIGVPQVGFDIDSNVAEVVATLRAAVASTSPDYIAAILNQEG